MVRQRGSSTWAFVGTVYQHTYTSGLSRNMSSHNCRSRSLSTDSSAPQPVATATSPRSESPSVTQAPPNVVPATDIIHRTSKPALSDEQKYSELQSTQMKVTSPHLAPAIELCISEKVSSEKAEEMLTPAPDK